MEPLPIVSRITAVPSFGKSCHLVASPETLVSGQGPRSTLTSGARLNTNYASLVMQDQQRDTLLQPFTINGGST